MIRVAMISFLAALVLLSGQSAAAQELSVSERALRAEVATSLPEWWQLTDFEITEIGGEDLMARASGKIPAAAPVAPSVEPGDVSDDHKPGAGLASTAVEQVVRFSAQLRLTQELYEPLYSTEGAAFVTEMVGPGLHLAVTGTIGISGTADDAEFGAVVLDQRGLETLGKPLDGFDLPAYLVGSEEATAYLEERAAAQAEGTLRKLLNESGDEL